MNAARARLLRRRRLAVLLCRLAILALLAWPVASLPPPAAAAGSGDLLSAIPVVDENALNNAACGVAAATMVLDYYLPQSGPVQKAFDVKALAQYVKQYAVLDRIKGTTFDQLAASPGPTAATRSRAPTTTTCMA